MDKKRIWVRFGLVLLSLWALAYVLPTLVGPDKLPKWYTNLFSAKLEYGLDLQGGLELRYTVDIKKAIRDNSNRIRETLVARLAEKVAEKEGKDVETLTRDERKVYEKEFSAVVDDYRTVAITFNIPEQQELLDQEFLDLYSNQYVIAGSDGNTLRVTLPETAVAELSTNIVNETLGIIRKRVEAFGLVEPEVRRVGEFDISVQLPGVDKKQMDIVRARIGQTAQLTFRILDPSANFFSTIQAQLDSYKAANPTKAQTLQIADDSTYGGKTITARSKAELVSFVKTLTVPQDHTIGYEYVENRTGDVVQESFWKTLYMFSKIELSGDYLTRAQVLNDPQEGWFVSLEMNGEGADIFADVTTQHTGKNMAIMLDDDVNSAPTIREPIRGGRARITMGGNRSPNEILTDARALVTVLNHGAYKAPVHKVHDHEVGPTLGADAIASGKLSLGVGALLVVLFMIVYYKRAGMISIIALALNVLFIVAVLVNFNAALTLPGLAGLVLTIGMAVDANVLIYERIREEIRSGRPARACIEAGYDRAFSTIFDANITTALTGVILMNYSTGPIYGFAVVLLTGIVCSVFTAYFVTRVIFEWLLEKQRAKTISI
ncbi:MAG: protein translocase subunit SecD [Myxococcales bacterium]|nr:protein translocase subunit SecD [Myxococcales bacterium]